MKNLLTAVILVLMMTVTATIAIAGEPRGDLGGKIRSIKLFENVAHKDVTTMEQKRSFFQLIAKRTITEEKVVVKKTFVRMFFELKPDMGFTCQDIPLEKVRFRPIGNNESPHIDIFVYGFTSRCYNNFGGCLDCGRDYGLKYVVVSIPEKAFPAERFDILNVGNVN